MKPADLSSKPAVNVLSSVCPLLGMWGTQRRHRPLPCHSQVLPLHGGLPPSQQARVFNRPPKGGLGLAGVCSKSG